MDQQENPIQENQFDDQLDSNLTPGPTTDPASNQPTDALREELSLAERAVQRTRAQASEAAQSFRRGELVQSSMVDPAATNDDRLIAMLAYITQLIVPLAMPIIILISESGKRRPFQRYHAVQSLALSLLVIGFASAAAFGLGSLLVAIPPVGVILTVIAACLVPIAGLITLATVVYYGVQAYRGRRFAIPGLTSFLRDQGWLT